MDLKEIGINTSNWVDSAQDRNYWRANNVCGIGTPGFITIELVNVKKILHCCKIFFLVTDNHTK